MQNPRCTHLLVDLDILAENCRALRAMAGSRDIMAVIKADAYGHGDVMVAREYLRGGVNRFAVATLAEALRLRRHGITGELLILGYTDPMYTKELIAAGITQTVVGPEHAEALSLAAQGAGGTLAVHLKIDTGMSRIGFDSADAVIIDRLRAAAALPGLRVTGTFTHFASADVPDAEGEAFTALQAAEFRRVTEAAKAAGIALGTLHAANSSAALCFPDLYFDMIRPGSLVEGLDPMPSDYGTVMPFKPAVSFHTVVGRVKALAPGRTVGYAQTYRAERPMRVATLPIGYADGLPRALSNVGRVLIRGEFAPIVGKVCMDQTMVDVTDIPDVCPGDRVTVFGTDGGNTLTLTELGECIDSMYLDVMARIGRRVPIFYLRGGEVEATLDYLAGGLRPAADA